MAQEFDFDIGNVVGPPGNTGNGIKSIELLSTSGLVKTYRITFTDDTHFDFSVSDGEDGNGISGASFDADTNELTITFDDGTSFTTPSLKGAPGNPGDDGYSPAITIETITGGHRVTITDEAHPTGQSFDVLDGASDAGAVTYNPETAYNDGTVGKAVSDLTRQISDVEENQIPELKNAIGQLDTDKQDAPSSAGAAGQVLGLDSNLDPVWVNQSGGGGTSDYTQLSNKPQINSVTLTGNKSLSDIGAIAAPSSPSTGAFLVWNGTAWVAQTLATWQGGSY